MVKNVNTKALLRKMLPRVVKAVIKSIFWFVLLYVIPMLIISSLSTIAPEVSSIYGQLLPVFVAITLFFVVSSELTSGTIFQHAFNIAKDLILMVFMVYALQGGIISIDLENVHILADLRIYLVMLLTIDFLGLAKSVLQAVNFLSEKVENSKLPIQ